MIADVGIVGVPNAGKSTLLNTLTRSTVLSEDKLFATLETTTRRLRFPKDREIVLSDTVGFIHDLPQDLVPAFKSTLEESQEADLLLHIIDISTEGYEERIRAVNKILADVGLENKPQLLVFNKADAIEADVARGLAHQFDALAVSALQPDTLKPLLEVIDERLFFERKSRAFEKLSRPKKDD